MRKRFCLMVLALLTVAVGARATVTSQTTSVSFTCSGSTGPYPFTFPISDPTALTVIQAGATLLSTAYTVTPVNNNYANGGSVTLNSACSSGTLILQRETPLTQASVFTDNMPVPMKTFERGMDKLTEIDQEFYKQFNVFLGSQPPNLIYASPGSGPAGIATFRPSVGADLPFPTVSTLGGVESITCPNGQFLDHISTGGVPACSIPTGFASTTGLGNGTTVVDCSTVTGANFSAHANGCYAALPALGGVLDFRGLGGAQSIASTIDFTSGTHSATLLPIGTITPAANTQWKLATQQNLSGQGFVDSIISGISGTVPFITTAAGAINDFSNFELFGTGPLISLGTTQQDSSFDRLFLADYTNPVFTMNGGYYNSLRNSNLMGAGGRTLSLQEGGTGGSTSASNYFPNDLVGSAGGTSVYRGFGSNSNVFIKPDIEGSGIGFDDWGTNNSSLFGYYEGLGSTTAWAANTAFSAGTIVPGTGASWELCILAGTTGSSVSFPAAPTTAQGWGTRTTDGTAIWEQVWAGNIEEPGSSNTWYVGPDEQALDLSWSPYNVLMTSIGPSSVTANGQCGTNRFCIPSLQTNLSLSSRGGAAFTGGVNVIPLTLPTPVVSSYPGIGSTSVTYAVSCTIFGDTLLGYAGAGPFGVTSTGLTSFANASTSYSRATLGTLYAANVSHQISNFYYSVPLSGYNTQNYTTAALAGGTGYHAGDTIHANSSVGTAGVLTVDTVTTPGGGVLTLHVSTPGTGYQPQYQVTTTALTGAGSGAIVDIFPYYNTIFFPPYGTGNGASGHSDVRTTGCEWDVAVNDNAHSLVTLYTPDGTNLGSGLLNGSVGVYFDYGQALTAYTAQTRNSTGDFGAVTETLKPELFSTLPACASSYEGMKASVTDASANTWGTTITGSSSYHVMAYCDGTNWSVIGK